MATSNLKLVEKPEEYFREKVNVAATELKIEIDDHLEFYLVNLLCEFIDLSRVNEQAADDVFEQPLALMLQKALESPVTAQPKIFKAIGDTSLYVAGYFQDYFNRKAFDLGYYITIGSNAYAHLSGIMRERHRDENFATIYEGLAGKFDKLVDVVAEVSDSHGGNDNNNILAIYDRWNRVKSDRLRRILERQGIHPISVPIKIAQ